MSTTIQLLFLSVRYTRSITSHNLQLIIWVAILLYDYCLTFVAEVERCWGVRQLNWALAFFYLNRYLVLFSHAPVMMLYFWSTSNTNKTEVSNLLPKGPDDSGARLKRYWHAIRQMLVSIHLGALTWPGNLIIYFLQLSPLAIVSPMPNCNRSDGHCL